MMTCGVAMELIHRHTMGMSRCTLTNLAQKEQGTGRIMLGSVFQLNQIIAKALNLHTEIALAVAVLTVVVEHSSHKIVSTMILASALVIL